MRRIAPVPLTAEAFAAFGDVIEVSDRAQRIEVNYGAADRFHDLAGVDVAEAGGRPAVSLFRARPLAAPLTLSVMERHPLASQAFVPLEGRPYLVAVAPAGALDPAAIRVFRAEGSQGVNYHRGVWHHFLLALEAESLFLVVDREGPGENLDEVWLDEDQRLEVAP